MPSLWLKAAGKFFLKSNLRVSNCIFQGHLVHLITSRQVHNQTFPSRSSHFHPMRAGDDREEKGLRLDDFAKKVRRAKGWGNREPITMEAHQNQGWERRQVSQELLDQRTVSPRFQWCAHSWEGAASC